jgi:GntR family transcriptional regulator, transcriptional repressor for pyruvate dehydrogenase complex
MPLKRTHIEQPVYARVIEQIQDLIRRGELLPGDYLLPERQLAETLKVSRSSVREALAVLVGKGIIEINPRNGALIKRQSLEAAIEPLAQVFFQERARVFELFEVRQIIETQAVRLAAQRRERSDIERLEMLCQRVTADVAAGNPADESDTLFHLGLVEAARNQLLTSVMGTLIVAMMDVYSPSRRQMLAEPAEAGKFLEEHTRIVAAIAAGEADMASEYARLHIEHARQHVANEFNEA